MDQLIESYMESRWKVRAALKAIKERIRRMKEDDPDRDKAQFDRTLLESMLRDLTEVIMILRNRHTFSDVRGYKGRGQILMDPAQIRKLEIKVARFDPELETALRNEIKETMEEHIRERMSLLTIKQRTTLTRWIDNELTISDIAREDGVSRQAIWVRLFGDKTNRGALKILRGEDLHGEAEAQRTGTIGQV